MGACVTSVAKHLDESTWDCSSQDVADEGIDPAGKFLADIVGIQGALRRQCWYNRSCNSGAGPRQPTKSLSKNHTIAPLLI